MCLPPIQLPRPDIRGFPRAPPSALPRWPPPVQSLTEACQLHLLDTSSGLPLHSTATNFCFLYCNLLLGHLQHPFTIFVSIQLALQPTLLTETSVILKYTFDRVTTLLLNILQGLPIALIIKSKLHLSGYRVP